MRTKSIKQTILALAAGTLTGARRVAMLLVMMLTMTAQTAWAQQTTIDLGRVNSDITLTDKNYVYGELQSNVQVFIANGATVTLNDVTIDRSKNNVEYVGITCLGDATIILADNSENSVKGGQDCPGI